ncbi:uncharacterized protein LOC131049520 [Cryptomeria japonica]|uniref:uncharacterized protein LOC131049520 n=1 Tax=Cryptomeria japonica TaxID=3369 RepID=UPI0027DA09E7|nr:uncharacterized protein LOC131049520 [Cryptomeria japonica]
MRPGSRKNTSTEPDEAVGPLPTTKDIMEQVKKQMKKDKLLNKATNFGIREGLGAIPQAEIQPIRVAIGKMLGEGVMEKYEKGKANEGTSTSTQPPPDTTTTSTQPPPTTTTQAPIFTSSTTTIPIRVSMSTPTSTFATMIVTLPPLIQNIAPIMTPTTKRVTIHNIESNSDQEDQQPIIQLT